MRSHTSAPISPWLVWINENDIRTAFNMAPRLEMTKEMRKLGWKVDLITCGTKGMHTIRGTEVMCFPRPKIYMISSMIFHLHAIGYILRNRNKISVVLFTQLSAPWILPLRLLRFLNRSHPVFVMDTRTVPMEPDNKATLKDKVRGRLLLLMNKTASWLADGQTAITKRMADLLNIPEKQLWGIWSSAVNPDQFCMAAEKRTWPKENDPVVVIYIGTLNYERNLMTLCRAITESNRRGTNFIFWLYGEGNEKRDLQAYAEQTGSCIQVFGVVPNEQIPEILAQSHVGALPFPDEVKYRVCSPIKLFEYMGAGMPILATRIVCHTDVIGGGDYAFWAEDSDVNGLLVALQEVWERRSDLSDLGKEALFASQNWTWGSSAKRLDEALQYGLSLYRKQR